MPRKSLLTLIVKTSLAFLLLILTACVSSGSGGYPGSGSSLSDMPKTDNQILQNMRLVFQEEFNENTLNEDIWHAQYRWGPKNHPELQYYTPEALDINDGILRIKAEKRRMEKMSYISGVIASYDKFTFTYGYVEMRARLPAGQGLWPAFWLHLNNDDLVGEIDIFEMLGHEPDLIYMSTHFPGRNGESEDETHTYQGPDFSQDYHTFAVDWQPEAITWYVDGIQRSQISHDIPSGPMYILANLAVGGAWGGNPDRTTRFPAYYDIDYIRVYQ
jgi:beta-glucanase (GH16 family)